METVKEMELVEEQQKKIESEDIDRWTIIRIENMQILKNSNEEVKKGS
jgi:hypothetical protein